MEILLSDIAFLIEKPVLPLPVCEPSKGTGEADNITCSLGRVPPPRPAGTLEESSDAMLCLSTLRIFWSRSRNHKDLQPDPKKKKERKKRKEKKLFREKEIKQRAVKRSWIRRTAPVHCPDPGVDAEA